MEEADLGPGELVALAGLFYLRAGSDGYEPRNYPRPAFTRPDAEVRNRKVVIRILRQQPQKAQGESFAGNDGPLMA